MAEDLLEIRAGDLTESVTFKSPSTEVGAAGSRKDNRASWPTFATRRAKVEQIAGDEAELAFKTTARQSYRITLRHLSGVTPQMVIDWEGQTLEIESVDNVFNRNRKLIVIAKVAS